MGAVPALTVGRGVHRGTSRQSAPHLLAHGLPPQFAGTPTESPQGRRGARPSRERGFYHHGWKAVLETDRNVGALPIGRRTQDGLATDESSTSRSPGRGGRAMPMSFFLSHPPFQPRLYLWSET